MMLDNQLVLSDQQALTATAVSTNKFDTGLASSKFGAGRPMGIAFFVDVAADVASGDETYAFAVVSDTDAALGSPTTHESRAIDKATLVAGYKFFIAIPPEADVERYVGVSYTLGGTTPTITVTAAIMAAEEFEVWKGYPNGYTIS